MLEMALINGRSKKKGAKKKTTSKKRAKKATPKKRAKKATPKKRAKKATPKKRAKKGSRGGKISWVHNSVGHDLPKGATLRFAKKPNIKKVSKKKIQKLSKNARKLRKSERKFWLEKNKSTVSGQTWRNPMRKRRKHKKNPQFNLNTILNYGAGAVGAVVINKFGTMAISKVLAFVPVEAVKNIATKIESDRKVNAGVKVGIAALAFLGSKKIKNARAQQALVGLAAAQAVLAGLQFMNINVPMISQSGLGDIDGIEMDGIEMDGIEMDGIEEMNGIESMEGIEEMGEVYVDGMNGGDEFIN